MEDGVSDAPIFLARRGPNGDFRYLFTQLSAYTHALQRSSYQTKRQNQTKMLLLLRLFNFFSESPDMVLTHYICFVLTCNSWLNYVFCDVQERKVCLFHIFPRERVTAYYSTINRLDKHLKSFFMHPLLKLSRFHKFVDLFRCFIPCNVSKPNKSSAVTGQICTFSIKKKTLK